jgi:transposase InsO family protein
VILEGLDEAQLSGARLMQACEIVGMDPRTVQRWRTQGGGDDRREGPHREPANKLSAHEHRRVLAIATSPEFRDLSPQQIVPALADRGTFVASESTFYRVLRGEKLLTHRHRSRPQSHQRPAEHIAEGPNQVWSWDITYLRAAIRGEFFYLYLILDIWSRKIVGWSVHTEESSDHAAALFLSVCRKEHLDPRGIVLHSDNGGPMKGSTMLATLQRLGVVPSFSRPKVSDDNPFSEALFRTLKYRPDYLTVFASPDAAAAWISAFVSWYNGEHLHSAVRFVTPSQRHEGREATLLPRRHAVYQAARRRHPNRWTGSTRNWTPIATVVLNPSRKEAAAAPAA